MRHLLTTLFFLSLASLGAQQRVRATLTWADAPRVVAWGDERTVQFGYTLAVTNGATIDTEQNNLGADAGAMIWGKEPRVTVTFPAAAGRAYDVEIISTSLEPAAGVKNPAGLPTTLEFITSVSRQSEGYVGKVAAPAVINGANGPQRLTGFDVRLVPAASPKNGPRMTFATTSALRQGEWFRVDVEAKGLHKLSREFITGTLGAELDGIDPRNIALFGQTTSGKLPELTNAAAPDDLVEIPIVIDGEADGSFDGGDALLFYANGPDAEFYDEASERFVYRKNVYSDINSYFLRIGGAPGARVSVLPDGSGTATTDTYDAFYHYEEDRFNVLHELGGNAHGSGQNWYGEFFKVDRDKTYSNVFRIPGLVAGQTANFRSVMALRSEATSRYFAEVDGTRLESATASRIRFGSQEQSPAVRRASIQSGVVLNSENVSVTIDYPTPAGTDLSEAYLDYFELEARRRLLFGELDQFTFLDTDSGDQPGVTYRFGDFPSDGRVWRIDGADVRSASLNNGQFSAPAGGRVFTYVAFRSGANLLAPVGGERVDNQNLHAIDAADLLIVTHPDFLSQAQELADHRRNFSGLNVTPGDYRASL